MALIHFDKKDLRDPFDSERILIGVEPAPLCDGEDCGARVFLTDEDLERYGGRKQEPLPPHYHVIISGENPPTRTERYPISA